MTACYIAHDWRNPVILDGLFYQVDEQCLGLKGKERLNMEVD